MYCKHCGNRIGDNDMFCSKCGQRLHENREAFIVRGGVLEKYCGSDMDVCVPEGVIEIAREAFDDCRQIKKITLGKDVRIARIVHCMNLETIIVSDGIKQLTVVDCENLVHVNLPEGIESFCLEASAITSITIPSSVIKISERAFRGCKNLESVKMTDSVEIVEKEAFYKCTKLKHIELPDSIHTLGEACFEECISLERIKLPSQIKEIPAGAFQGCVSLTAVDIPYGVTTISGKSGDGYWYGDRYAFAKCERIKKVTIPDTVTFICSRSFDGCSSLRELNISTSLYEKSKRKYKGLGEKKENHICGFENTPISWKFAECCQYCGDVFGGVFDKKCKRCGKPKDY